MEIIKVPDAQVRQGPITGEVLGAQLQTWSISLGGFKFKPSARWNEEKVWDVTSPAGQTLPVADAALQPVLAELFKEESRKAGIPS